MNKPNFRPIAPLEVDDHALDQVNERLGVPQMVRPASQKSQQAVETASRQTVKTARRQQKLTVRIPDYLVHEMKHKAVEERTTVRHLVLLAMQKAGYKVEAADLLPGAGGSD